MAGQCVDESKDVLKQFFSEDASFSFCDFDEDTVQEADDIQIIQS